MKKLFKNKTFWINVSSIIVVAIAFYFAGGYLAKSEIDEVKVTYNQAIEKLESIEAEVESANKELEEVNGELESNQDELQETLSLIDSKSNISIELEELEGRMGEYKEEIESLASDIEAKAAELEKLETGVAKKKEEPIELISGTFTVGEDVPEGRYQATNVGNGSNFVVYSGGGSLKVNTILGDDWYGDYVFFAEEGDIIETSAQVKLIPVE